MWKRDAEISSMSKIRRASKNMTVPPAEEQYDMMYPSQREIKVWEWEREGGETGKETERSTEKHWETRLIKLQLGETIVTC